MSLEAKIEALTQAVQALTAQMQSRDVAQAPVAVPVASAPVIAAPVMPTLPPFAAPVVAAPVVAAPAPIGAPFTDGKGLIDYVMSSYKAMGPQKGAQIQSVLTGLGYQNINDVKPEHYGALFQGIEQLKAM